MFDYAILLDMEKDIKNDDITSDASKKNREEAVGYFKKLAKVREMRFKALVETLRKREVLTDEEVNKILSD